MFVFSARAAYFPDPGARTLTGDWDFGSGGLEVENNTAFPAGCTTGQVFMDTDATSGDQFFFCESGAWIAEGDGAPIRYDQIGDSSANADIGFTTYTNTWTTAIDGGEFFRIADTGTPLTAVTYLMNLQVNPQNDGQNVFFRFYDNTNTLKFRMETGSLYIGRLVSLSATDVKRPTTYIDMSQGDRMTFFANDVNWWDMTEAGADTVVFNEGGVDADLRWESNNNANMFYLDAGNNRVGIGLATPNEELEVAGDLQVDMNNAATTNGVCHDGAATNAATTNRRLVVCSGAAVDIAEWYETTGAEPGDIVAASARTIEFTSFISRGPANPTEGYLDEKVSIMRKTNAPYDPLALGIVSTAPVKTFGRAVIEHSKNPNAIALAGRVPVKVSLENGPIKPGDMIAASRNPGVGMKATEAGRVVAMALEAFDGSQIEPGKRYGEIMSYVNPHWWGGPEGASTPVMDDALLERLKNSRDAVLQLKREIHEFKNQDKFSQVDRSNLIPLHRIRKGFERL